MYAWCLSFAPLPVCSACVSVIPVHVLCLCLCFIWVCTSPNEGNSALHLRNTEITVWERIKELFTKIFNRISQGKKLLYWSQLTQSSTQNNKQMLLTYNWMVLLAFMGHFCLFNVSLKLVTVFRKWLPKLIHTSIYYSQSGNGRVYNWRLKWCI